MPSRQLSLLWRWPLGWVRSPFQGGGLLLVLEGGNRTGVAVVVVAPVAPVAPGRSVVGSGPLSAECVCEPGSAARMKEEPSHAGGVRPPGWGPRGRPPHDVLRVRVPLGTVLCRACAVVVTTSGAAVRRPPWRLHECGESGLPRPPSTHMGSRGDQCVASV